MSTSNNYPFILAGYLPGGRNRYTCPKCGGRKCFTRYLYAETGEEVGDECGICDHKSSCQYHKPPREYFIEHPEKNSIIEYKPKYINDSPLTLKGRKPSSIIQTQPTIAQQAEFFPLRWAEVAVKRDCTFKQWFRTLPYDAGRILQILEDYYVGGTKEDTYVDHLNYGSAVVFWMIDEQQRVHDAKLIAYKSDGHRVQGWGNSMRSICTSKGIGPQLTHTDKTLFGLHLIARYPEKPVCIVESEKTALVCACRYPDFVWTATGGCGNLQIEKLRPLMDKKLVIYPDAGEYEDWMKKMQESGHKDYRVVDFMERYEANTDIADILLGKAKLKRIGQAVTVPILPVCPATSSIQKTDMDMDIQTELWQAMKDSNPAAKLLEEKFDLIMKPPIAKCPF